MLLRAAAALDTCAETGRPSPCGAASEIILEVTTESNRLARISRHALAEACLQVVELIEDVVIVKSPVVSEKQLGSCSTAAAAATVEVPAEHTPSVDARSLSESDRETILRMFQREESRWEGRVTRAAVGPLYADVETTAEELCGAIEADFGPLLAAPSQRDGVRNLVNMKRSLAGGGGGSGATLGSNDGAARSSARPARKSSVKGKPTLVLDYRDVALWLQGDVVGACQSNKDECSKMLSDLAALGAAVDGDRHDTAYNDNGTLSGHLQALEKRLDALENVEFVHPYDRWGKRVEKRWSTVRVEKARHAYRAACERAKEGVSAALKQLAADITEPSTPLLHHTLTAANFSLTFRTLMEHQRAALPQRWELASLLRDDGDCSNVAPSTPVSRTANNHHKDGGDAVLDVTGFWPYWKQQHDAVSNDLTLDKMAILSGPNMGGKSTISRSVAAVSLLAHCGLYTPSVEANIPELDSIFLRMAGSDSPAEGESGFAMEMLDLQSVLREATDKTLVFLDEIGRATEASAGAAIAAAVLEELSSRGTLGIFSTHLHPLLDIDWGESVTRLSMGTKENEVGALHSTHRLHVGVDSRVTLAFEVAMMKGLSPKIVARAHEFHSLLNSKDADVVDIDDAKAGRTRRGSSVSTSAASDRTPKALIATLERVARSSGMKAASVVELGIYEVPGASLAASSVVYVLVSKAGAVRVGETDDLTTRLYTHRNSDAKWTGTFVLRVTDKSMARKVETMALQALRKKGWALANESDASHTAFGKL